MSKSGTASTATASAVSHGSVAIRRTPIRETWYRCWIFLNVLAAHAIGMAAIFLSILFIQTADEYIWPPDGHVFFRGIPYFEFHISWALDAAEVVILIFFILHGLMVLKKTFGEEK